MNINKKKILLVIKTPPPVTGATMMNKQVYDSKLLKDNYDIRSINISYTKNVSDLGKINIKKLQILLRIIIRLNRELIFERPDVVYFQLSPTGYGFYRDLIYIFLIKLFMVKTIFHLHGKGIRKLADNSIHKLFYRFAFKNSDIICLSELLKYDIDTVFKGQVHIVNNGIPEMSIPRISSYQIGQNETIKILFLSNLLKSKGILDFIKALDILNKKRVVFEGTIVGGEGDINKQELQDILEKYNIENIVNYIGPIYGDEKNDIYYKSDIVVFPTKNDTWGNVILEAMQFAKPVVATREGSIPKIIDNGVTGFIVDKDAPEQIADKIEILIKQPDDRLKMGKAAREKFYNNYTLSIFEKNLSTVFHNVLYSCDNSSKV